MSQIGKKRLFFRWSYQKKSAATVLFFLLALFSELFVVLSFRSFGLTDKTLLVGNFQFFVLAISPLLHLLPLTMIIVLFCSWLHLTKYTYYLTGKKVSKYLAAKKLQGKRRFRTLRLFSKRLSRKLKGIKAWFQQIRGISYVFTRLDHTVDAVRSAVIVLAVFMLFSLLLYIVVYPDLIHNWIIGLYQGNPYFLNLVRKTTLWAHAFGDALAWVFAGVAPSFYRSIRQTGASLTGYIVQLDTVSKYLLSQNVAAWASALIVLFYGKYVSSRRHKKR